MSGDQSFKADDAGEPARSITTAHLPTIGSPRCPSADMIAALVTPSALISTTQTRGMCYGGVLRPARRVHSSPSSLVECDGYSCVPYARVAQAAFERNPQPDSSVSVNPLSDKQLVPGPEHRRPNDEHKLFS